MVNPKLGIKRTCPSCGTHFYDLNANPAKCPKCKNSFNPEQGVKPRRGKGAKKIAPLPEDVKKKAEMKKAKKVEGIDLAGFDDADTAAGGEEMEAMEDVDEMEAIEEISEFDDMEEKNPADDEADEESLIDELDPAEKKIVDSIDEEE